LRYRQIRGDMIKMYKILSEKYDTTVTPRVTRELSYITKGNDLRLKKGRSNIKIRLVQILFY